MLKVSNEGHLEQLGKAGLTLEHIVRQRELTSKLKESEKATFMSLSNEKKKEYLKQFLAKWHESTKGKSFHRDLADFISWWIRYPEIRSLKISSGLKSVSSCITHLVSEGEYFRPIAEQVRVETAVEIISSVLVNILRTLMQGEEIKTKTLGLETSQLEALIFIVHPNDLFSAILYDKSLEKDKVKEIFSTFIEDYKSGKVVLKYLNSRAIKTSLNSSLISPFM